MRTTCLINSYNYRRFVSDAVDSALCQSRPVDQIVVVDDGSTDGSADMLRDRYGDEPRVEIVCKSNGGQLSCFEEGVRRATGDIVFFLDADDVWEPSYVETVIQTYESRPDTDFVFCGLRRFGNEDSTLLPCTEDRALGCSVALTSFKRSWKGTATSALSMRRWVLDRLFPIPFLEDWRIRADDCLVYGADLVGASKYYLARPLVRYRVHDSNHYYGRTWSESSKYRRKLALARFVKTIQNRMGLDVESLADLAHIEFETIERPTLKDLQRYARVVRRADCPITTRLDRVLRMAALAYRRRRSGETESGRRERVARLTRELARAKARESSDARRPASGVVPRPVSVTAAILVSLTLFI
jgi:glycosyltransferase involved in cell wall biosynthesis